MIAAALIHYSNTPLLHRFEDQPSLRYGSAGEDEHEEENDITNPDISREHAKTFGAESVNQVTIDSLGPANDITSFNQYHWPWNSNGYLEEFPFGFIGTRFGVCPDISERRRGPIWM